jgi:hypothetical protein
MFHHHGIEVNYREKLRALSMVSTPDMARVTTDLSFVHLSATKHMLKYHQP